jgi:hypothetical protein
MQRFLYRVQYTYPAQTVLGVTSQPVSYESVCVRADDETAALADVEVGTLRYMTAVGATRTLTLLSVTADV